MAITVATQDVLIVNQGFYTVGLSASTRNTVVQSPTLALYGVVVFGVVVNFAWPS